MSQDVKREQARAAQTTEPADLYLELLKKSLCGCMHEHVLYPVAPAAGGVKNRVFEPIRRVLASRGFVLARKMEIRPETFSESPPPYNPVADTLIGPQGLQNIRDCVEDVLDRGIPGDLIEAGAWRGGATVFMRALLQVRGDTARTVWVADSFQGMPTPGALGHEADIDEEYWAELTWLDIPLDQVKRTFERYGLLDERVQFLTGWFGETLPSAPIEKLALIRLDADMYGSTMDALTALYPRLSVGGYVIVDDYWLPKCRAAVDDYRREHEITDEIKLVDRAIAYWRRSVSAVTIFVACWVEQAETLAVLGAAA
jgi:O-methyltransferase